MSDLRYDDEPLPVYDRYGPFSSYAPRSVGVGYTGLGCRCDQTRGQSCPTCADKPSGATREVLPPCMKPGWTPEAARAREVAFAASRGHQWAIAELAQTSSLDEKPKEGAGG